MLSILIRLFSCLSAALIPESLMAVIIGHMWSCLFNQACLSFNFLNLEVLLMYIVALWC